MKITTKIDNKLKKLLKGNIKELQENASRRMGPPVVDEILELLEDGISPTKGGKFKDTYSYRYRQEIIAGKYANKTISPVNLKLTGKLYESLEFTIKILKRSAKVRFTFKNKERAKDHDEGRKGLPVRRLLPNKKEKWHTNINRIVRRSVLDALRDFAKKYSD